MAKKYELATEGATEISAKESQELATRSYQEQFLSAPPKSSFTRSPDFINVNKINAEVTLGKDNYKILKKSEGSEAVILNIGALMFMKWQEGNTGLPPDKITPEEAEDAGEVLYWPSDGAKTPRPTVTPYRELVMLIRSPDDDLSPAFKVFLNDDDWALGKYSCGGTAYYQNMPDDHGILDDVRLYTQDKKTNKTIRPWHQLLWGVHPDTHIYKTSGNAASYLKLTFKKLMKEDDKLFVAIDNVMRSGN